MNGTRADGEVSRRDATEAGGCGNAGRSRPAGEPGRLNAEPAGGERAPGLRARKKARQRRDIERAILTTVIERGYERTTVEGVCAELEISKKTFFNYFPTKNAAILGVTAASCSPDDLARMLAERGGAPYLDVLSGYVTRNLYPVATDREIGRLRLRALAEIPQLAFGGSKSMIELNRTMAACLRAHLEARPEDRLRPDLSLKAEVSIAASTAICLARTRYVLGMCCDMELSQGESRRLISDFLAAGDGDGEDAFAG